MFRAQPLGFCVPRHRKIGISVRSDEKQVWLGGVRARDGLKEGRLAVDGAGVPEDEAIGRLSIEFQAAGFAVYAGERSTGSFMNRSVLDTIEGRGRHVRNNQTLFDRVEETRLDCMADAARVVDWNNVGHDDRLSRIFASLFSVRRARTAVVLVGVVLEGSLHDGELSPTTHGLPELQYWM